MIYENPAESDQVRKALESRLPSLTSADDGHPDCLLSLLMALTSSESSSPDHGAAAANGETVAGTRKCSSVCLGMCMCVCVCVLGNDFMALTSSESVRIAISKVLVKISWLSLMSFVYMSKCHPIALFFVASLNLAISWPRHRVFACLLMVPKGLGSESQWKWWANGSGFSCKNFSSFHPLLPPQKAKFLFCLAWPPLQVASFWAF